MTEVGLPLLDLLSCPMVVRPDGFPCMVAGKGESLYLYVLSSNQHNKKMENKEKETTVSKFAENPYVEIKKRVSMAGVWSVLVAVVAFVASGFMTDPQSSLKLFLIVVGVCFLIYGLIKLAVGNKVAVCRANGKVLKKHELLFESSEVSRLKQMVESGNFQSIGTLPRAVGHKAGAKLTLFIDADQSFATAQVSEFIPFDYEPVMSPMSYNGDSVKAIAALTHAA